MRTSAPLYGSTTPRIWTPPLVTGPPGPCGCGCALTPATSWGFSAVDFHQDVLGIRPLPWQRWLLIHALERLPSGRFRFRTVVTLVARQNGKTTIFVAKNLWKMYVLELPLIIGTAQTLEIAEEAWQAAVELAEATPELAAEIASVIKVNGKKTLKLANGSRWKIAAASRRGGRGLSGDDINLDELREQQTWDAWGAITKTTMARPDAQIWCLSNAGDARSVVLNDLVEKGRAAAAGDGDETLGLFEWSAADDVRCTCGQASHTLDCRLQDRSAWAQANPSLGYTITAEAIASALATDPEAIFRTEVLCQRVPDLRGEWQVIAQDEWEHVTDALSTTRGKVALAVDITPDRGLACIGVYGLRPDGLGHAEIVEHREGTDWVLPRLLQLVKRWQPVGVGLDIKGPAGSLLIPLKKAGLTLSQDLDAPGYGDLAIPSAQDVTAACGQFADAVRQQTFRHIGQDQLEEAVKGVRQRQLADAWAWGRRISSVDISPLVAVTLARWVFESRAHLVGANNYDVADSFG